MKSMKFSSLYLVIAVVLGFSLFFGYWRADTPFKGIILIEDFGYSAYEVGQFLFLISFVILIVEFSGSALIFVVSYYSDKKFELSVNSALVLLILLICLILSGSLVGHVIRQLEIPQYTLLFQYYVILNILGHLLVPLLSSFAGILAGNYRRELLTNREAREITHPNSI